ncbi:alpha-beta hydrolase superfamily lysophospholipase [Kutzneria buriramensis]|uniref:Alpha-beta hydrolase superfamily lysophospholipase n=1 Tax=Kutzneria buriramensis TaxID=1045776 RepID=A0A3E0I0U2_9PSEU|nr:alpha-beta hydrolase superfamily lysophospholipase [Kutzneria buriramensis]
MLGEGYEVVTLPLGALPAGAGPGGDNVAHLVRRRADGNGAEKPVNGAVLYVHGFVDYFFQTHVAEHFAARGYDFYAVDLRAYGRSLQPGQVPNFVTDLSYHFEELDAAARIIRDEHGHSRLTLMGHSTGGLISIMWAHERRDDNVLDALVLNSPWVDLQENWFMRTVGTWAVDVLGKVSPTAVVQNGLESPYGLSLHRDDNGEWEFDTDWKPKSGFPVRAGWLRTIRRNQARLHRGLDVRVPVLLLRSSHSLLKAKEWTPEAMRADTVLDVAQMAKWAPKIGPNVTVVAIEGGMHDLFLSAPAVRERVLSETDSWLEGLRQGDRIVE